jgi:hypothetical protein
MMINIRITAKIIMKQQDYFPNVKLFYQNKTSVILWEKIENYVKVPISNVKMYKSPAHSEELSTNTGL